tara:strand:- start:8193 stop:9713 length:1521 start_codon:yes stop_codon:yes gene_type:complete
MSLKLNIISNYASQIYVSLIGIIMVPLYIKYMGVEAYGLVGFFAMLQAWFVLLDFGLTPTISREVARFSAGFMDALSFRRLYRAISIIFFTIALIGGGGLLLLSSMIARDWLNAVTIPLNEIQVAVQIMAVSVSLRWICGLYRGVITGSERFIWLGGFNALIATFRFLGVLLVMWYLGFTPIIFFSWQLLISVVEIVGLWLKSNCLLPSVQSASGSIGWSLTPLRSVIKFSLMLAFSASVWIMVTQTDKLVLSAMLPLAEYGYFTLAVLVASGIMLLGGPVSGAIMPRMAKLEAEGDRNEVIRIYRQSTQLVVVIAGSAAVTIAFCAQPLLWAWTGDAELASKSAPILTLYAIGNGILMVAAFPYYLQYARGNLRLHFIGNLLLLCILIPSVVLATIYYGVIGAGSAWILINLVYLLVWVAVVHSRLEPGLHNAWIVWDVLVVIIPAVLVSFVIFLVDVGVKSRVDSFLYVVVFAGIVFSLEILMLSAVRNYCLNLYKSKPWLTLF